MTLEIRKEDKVNELRAECKRQIFKGFRSDGLGTYHWYDGMFEDQLNLIGLVVSGESAHYPVRSAFGEPKEYKEHSPIELQRVLSDGKAFKTGVLQYFNVLRTAVEAATTEAEVDAIVWGYGI